MRATYLYGAGDVRVVDVPDAKIEHATDAVVRVTRACVCGSDLHPYHSKPPTDEGSSIGHEFIGVVEETGPDVRTVAPGDVVIGPFAVSCGVCEFCRAGLQTWMAWLSRAGFDGTYLASVAAPMMAIGAGQGLAFAPLTNAGIAGVPAADAGAASGLVNTAHQLWAWHSASRSWWRSQPTPVPTPAARPLSPTRCERR